MKRKWLSIGAENGCYSLLNSYLCNLYCVFALPKSEKHLKYAVTQHNWQVPWNIILLYWQLQQKHIKTSVSPIFQSIPHLLIIGPTGPADCPLGLVSDTQHWGHAFMLELPPRWLKTAITSGPLDPGTAARINSPHCVQRRLGEVLFFMLVAEYHLHPTETQTNGPSSLRCHSKALY